MNLLVSKDWKPQACAALKPQKGFGCCGFSGNRCCWFLFQAKWLAEHTSYNLLLDAPHCGLCGRLGVEPLRMGDPSFFLFFPLSWHVAGAGNTWWAFLHGRTAQGPSELIWDLWVLPCLILAWRLVSYSERGAQDSLNASKPTMGPASGELPTYMDANAEEGWNLKHLWWFWCLPPWITFSTSVHSSLEWMLHRARFWSLLFSSISSVTRTGWSGTAYSRCSRYWMDGYISNCWVELALT